MPSLWVQVIRHTKGPLAGAYGPDVPLRPSGEPAVDYRASIPVQIARGHPERGRPLVRCCRITVSEEDAARIKAAGKAINPSDEDRAVIEACSIPDDPKNRRFRDGAKARERFRALAQRGIPKSALKRALLEAARRGVRLEDAEAISNELGLENDTTSSGG